VIVELFASMSLPGGVDLRVGLGPEGMIGIEVWGLCEFPEYVADISPRLSVQAVVSLKENDIVEIAGDDSRLVLMDCLSAMSGAGTMTYHNWYINVSVVFCERNKIYGVIKSNRRL